LSAGPIVVVLYYAKETPLRTAVADHLFAIKRFGQARAIYVNAAVRGVPRWLYGQEVGLLVFHTSVLAQRWDPPSFAAVRKRLRPLRTTPWPKAAIPQDEFFQTDLLCDFIREFKVGHVFTVAAESGVQTVYGDLADASVTFHRVLTGYLDPATIDRIGKISASVQGRDLDVAYRAWRPEPWLGRHAQLKAQIGDVFAKAAPTVGMSTDISLRNEDTLIGDDWYRLLLRSRWTIGVEGGASAIDRDGSIRARTLTYEADHPGASFEEVEAACFPGVDGTLNLMALSPRHLEACATRTAQVLIEGDYNGVLEPGLHYLALKADFSNLNDVLSIMRDDVLRERIAQRAFDDVVGSGSYSSATLANTVLSVADGLVRPMSAVTRALVTAEGFRDRLSWAYVGVRHVIRPRVRRLLAALGLLGPAVRIRNTLSRSGD